MQPPADFQPRAAATPAVPPLLGEITPASPPGPVHSVDPEPNGEALGSELGASPLENPPVGAGAHTAPAPSHAVDEPARVTPSAAAENPAVDALVSSMANLIFVTTGPAACEALNLFPNQVALTPVVAERIAEVLRVVLQYPDVGTRAAIVEEWQMGELACVPGGRVEVDEHAVHVGIEPIGAGILVSVLWPHVPVLVWQLDQVARRMRGGHGA